MHRRVLFALATVSLTASLAGAAVFVAPHGPRIMAAAAAASPAPAADGYAVDPVHSMVIFKVRHLGVSNFYGRFNEVAGSYTYNAEDESISDLNVYIPTQSIDTNSPNRDGHLRSAEFFNVEEHPTMTFESIAVKKMSPVRYSAKGNLTFRGVTKEIMATVGWFGTRDAGPRFGIRSGMEAQFTINRSDFGMTAYVDNKMLGDEIKVTVALEGIKNAE